MNAKPGQRILRKVLCWGRLYTTSQVCGILDSLGAPYQELNDDHLSILLRP
jgi:hypothetical protein